MFKISIAIVLLLIHSSHVLAVLRQPDRRQQEQRAPPPPFVADDPALEWKCFYTLTDMADKLNGCDIHKQFTMEQDEELLCFEYSSCSLSNSDENAATSSSSSSDDGHNSGGRGMWRAFSAVIVLVWVLARFGYVENITNWILRDPFAYDNCCAYMNRFCRVLRRRGYDSRTNRRYCANRR
jgi:hypothetical protein